MFKVIRIILLSCVLLFVGFSAYTLDSNLRDWDETKWVVIYPINGDGSDVTHNFIEKIKDYDFDNMRDFLNSEAARFGVNKSPTFIVGLGPVLDDRPPAAPQNGRWYENAWWSLKLRMWASGVSGASSAGPPADIKIYVEYYDPGNYEVLPHSVGMKKLSLAVVKAFASKKMTQSNNIIMTHELLHIFGAVDKYDLRTSLPLYPAGYADSDKQPLYPQHVAEIMGGRIPLSQSEAIIPTKFKNVTIGEVTAKEVGWLN